MPRITAATLVAAALFAASGVDALSPQALASGDPATTRNAAPPADSRHVSIAMIAGSQMQTRDGVSSR